MLLTKKKKEVVKKRDGINKIPQVNYKQQLFTVAAREARCNEYLSGNQTPL